ncbi:MAG: PEP-CTERM sorting domain-containing protein [Capsulimonadales bacterium]|nr:PEP-CTERM sorting domain-containing protein [Capsulimonadales bacterium]
MKLLPTFLGAGLVAMVVASPVLAQTPALSFTGGSFTNNFPWRVQGYEFDVTAPQGVTVTALSYFDRGNDGLVEAHEVGIWNPAGDLLVSTVIPAGSETGLDSAGFRFVNITPISLPAAAGYIVGGTTSIGQFNQPDFSVFFWPTGSTVMAPGLTYVDDRIIDSPTLLRPTEGRIATGPGWAAGSFHSLLNTVSAPEPGSLALLLPLLGGLVARRRRP